MDRRKFIQTIMATPFVASHFVSSSKGQNPSKIFLISDQPHIILPSLLFELQREGLFHARSFGPGAFHHPQKEKIIHALSSQWFYDKTRLHPDMKISFNLLRNASPSSFVVIRRGKIWDVRTRKLYSLWEEMARQHSASSLLTILSFERINDILAHQPFARIFLEGIETDRLPLNMNTGRTYPCRKGEVSVSVYGGKACVKDSSCRQKICLLSPPVSAQGDRIICAPNHFLLEIRGSRSIDTVIG